MALRARLIPPQPEREAWPWHEAKTTSISASMLMGGDRRMEAESYLAGGYGVRLAIEARRGGWTRMGDLARVWQPSRLKGIQVSPEFGTPFLAAMQVFDLRPVPRKWLALERTLQAAERFVQAGTILVTCSGSVGRATLACGPHEKILISHDLLRVEPRHEGWWGWLYAYLRASQAREMMSASQYGHVIKHLETSHLNALPVLMLSPGRRIEFDAAARAVMEKRNRTHDLVRKAEDLFEESVGSVDAGEDFWTGFPVRASALFGGRRRLEGYFHNPIASAILERFRVSGRPVGTLGELTERIWWMSRFKRVFGDEGLPYMSAEELFSLNPPVTKRVMVEQAENSEEFYVKAGWIVMACSGQIYGLNGSVALMTEKHESAFFSHDLIRIIPERERVRPGYLLTVLGHPKLGRPLVIRYAYGTSIPHLEPADIAELPIIHLDDVIEADIARWMEEAVRLRGEADDMENAMAAEAEKILERFIAGDTTDMVMTGGID